MDMPSEDYLNRMAKALCLKYGWQPEQGVYADTGTGVAKQSIALDVAKLEITAAIEIRNVIEKAKQTVKAWGK